jgi:O-antigen/teichoic acid export membrane protein
VTAKSTIQTRTAMASVAGLASTAMAIALQIITVPVVLTYWGAERYGVWLVVMAGFLIARTVDGGYTAYVGNQLNVLYHEDQQELRRTLGSSLAICAGLGTLQLLLCIGLLATGVAPALFGVAAGSEEADEVGLAFVVLVLAWVLAGSFPSIIHRLLVPAGMLVNSIWWSMGYQVAQFSTVMSVAFAGATVFQAAAIYAGVQAGVYLVSAEYVRRRLPEFYPWWRGGRMASGLRDLYRSIALTANTGVQQAGVSGIVLIVASLLGAVAVPVFTTIRTLANLGTNLGNVLAGALSPEAVRFYATGQHEKLALAFRASALFSGLAVNLSMLAVLPFADTIYAIWTNGVVPFDQPLFLYLVAAVSVWNAGWTYSTFLTAINSLGAQLVLTLARCCAALGVGIMLIGTLGLPGVGLGILLGEGAAYLLAASVFAPRIVAARGGRLPRVDRIEGFLISLPVIAVSLFGVFLGTLPPVLIVSAAVAVLTFGWRAWLRLPGEARDRAASIFRFQTSTRP